MGFPSFCLLVCLLLAASSLISGEQDPDRRVRRSAEHTSTREAPIHKQPLEGCGQCDENKCRPPNADGDKPCLAGVIKDVCGCCYVCAMREGQRCFPLSPGVSGPSGCGDNLECRLRIDLPPEDPPEAMCVCKTNGVLCGSDGQTYQNECQLTEARYRKRVEEQNEIPGSRQRRFIADGPSNFIPLTASDEDPASLRAVSRGPCKTAPKIVSPPEDVTNHTGHNVALSCEATGWPVPVIEWMVDKGTNKIVPLPSDDPHIAVQSRGGPNHYEVTSWLQFLRVVPDDQAKYWCVAKNEVGEDSASGKVTVLKREAKSQAQSASRRRTG